MSAFETFDADDSQCDIGSDFDQGLYTDDEEEDDDDDNDCVSNFRSKQIFHFNANILFVKRSTTFQHFQRSTM